MPKRKKGHRKAKKSRKRGKRRTACVRSHGKTYCGPVVKKSKK